MAIKLSGCGASGDSREPKGRFSHHLTFTYAMNFKERTLNELEVAALVSLPSYRLKSPFDRLLQVIQRFCPV